MADGSQYIAGDLTVAKDLGVHGALTVGGNITVTGTISAATLAGSTSLRLTPTASPPSTPLEGMLYADYYNGTDWKEVSFAA